jgi:hypothetical protein
VLALSLGALPASAQPAASAGDAGPVGCVPFTEAAASATAVLSASAGACGLAREPTVTQDDCTVLVVSRGVWMDVLRPVVPDRYGLRTVTAAPGRPPGPYSSILIIDQYCEDVVVHGRHSVPSTTTYVVTPVTTIDGQSVTSTLYTLYIGTDNPELFALYRSAGLPADFLPSNSTTITHPYSTTTQAVFTIEGGQFDHTFSVLGYPPVEPYVFDPGANRRYASAFSTVVQPRQRRVIMVGGCARGRRWPPGTCRLCGRMRSCRRAGTSSGSLRARA